MEVCPASIVVNRIEDNCNGNQSSTNCVLFPNSIIYLGISQPNATTTEVIQALLTSLVDARNRIAVLEAQNADFESRITALENA